MPDTTVNSSPITITTDDGTIVIAGGITTITGGGGGGASALDDLTDVDVTTDPPAADDVLAYDSATSKWTPAGLSSVLGDAALLDVGTTAGTVAAGNDSRFTDARTPTAHASTHADGGADEISIAASQVTSGVLNIARLATGTPDGTKFVRDDGTLATPAGGGGSTRLPGWSYVSTTVSNAVAETCPPGTFFGNNAALTSGRLILVGIYLNADDVISNITFVSGSTAGATLTNQWMVLCDSSRTSLRYTANDTTTAWAASTPKTLALTSSYTVPTSGKYFVGLMVSATTVPSLRIGGATNTGVTSECFQSDSGLTTVPGATTFSRSTTLSGWPFAVVS